GLVIVDEEQRFGVEHKEQLKKLRANVDVLTMSATPIPRTLEMAVTGIREMSTITTPPEERHPVLTFVGPYDARQIGAAIRRAVATSRCGPRPRDGGRGGGAGGRGYAYFFYPPDKPPTGTANGRLATIAQHTEMGAGMYVAMKDLEIRGAGNLLGGEQSGHIAGVGFDLYVRMVGESVADYRRQLETGEIEEEPPL